MHRHMLNFWRYKATSRERHFIERTKAPIFLERVLAIEIIQEPQLYLEEKVNPSKQKKQHESYMIHRKNLRKEIWLSEALSSIYHIITTRSRGCNFLIETKIFQFNCLIKHNFYIFYFLNK